MVRTDLSVFSYCFLTNTDTVFTKNVFPNRLRALQLLFKKGDNTDKEENKNPKQKLSESDERERKTPDTTHCFAKIISIIFAAHSFIITRNELNSHITYERTKCHLKPFVLHNILFFISKWQTKSLLLFIYFLCSDFHVFTSFCFRLTDPKAMMKKTAAAHKFKLLHFVCNPKHTWDFNFT